MPLYSSEEPLVSIDAKPWVVKSADYTAQAGDRLFVDTSMASWTLSLPVTPAVGDTVEALSISAVAIHKLSISPNGSKYQGFAIDNVNFVNLRFTKPWVHVQFIYSGETQGWIGTPQDQLERYGLRTDAKNVLSWVVSPGEVGYTFYDTNNDLNKINDNVLTAGAIKTGGGTANQLHVVATFTQPTFLNQIEHYGGQFNGANHLPSRLTVHAGNSVSGEKLFDTTLLTNTTAKQTFDLLNLSAFNTLRTQYTFVYYRTSANVSVLELDLLGGP